jgi:leader peptidase (prepilin peptidase)/N-methyltransferase
MEKIQSRRENELLGGSAVRWTLVFSLAVCTGLLLFVTPVTAALSAYLLFTMTLITLVDLRHFIIPDVLSLPAIPVGLAASALHTIEGDWLAGLLDGLSGALIGAFSFLLLRALYFSLRQTEGLGLGDVKLAAVAGAWLGPAALAPACLVASLSAIAAVLLHAASSGPHAIRARRRIPFGSFIAPTILGFWVGQILGL